MLESDISLGEPVGTAGLNGDIIILYITHNPPDRRLGAGIGIYLLIECLFIKIFIIDNPRHHGSHVEDVGINPGSRCLEILSGPERRRTHWFTDIGFNCLVVGHSGDVLNNVAKDTEPWS